MLVGVVFLFCVGVFGMSLILGWKLGLFGLKVKILMVSGCFFNIC